MKCCLKMIIKLHIQSVQTARNSMQKVTSPKLPCGKASHFLPYSFCSLHSVGSSLECALIWNHLHYPLRAQECLQRNIAVRRVFILPPDVFIPKNGKFTILTLNDPIFLVVDGPKPCHVYLTLASNTSNSFNVMFHTTRQFSMPLIRFDSISHKNFLNYSFPLQASETVVNLPHGKRYVYVARLFSLLPETIYYFVVGDGEDGASYSSENMFRTSVGTLAGNNKSLKFAAGGDVGLYPAASKLISLAAQEEVDFIVFGGDLSYNNGMKTCYRRWDQWINLYERSAITPTGLMVPMLTTIGNHEAGGFGMTLADTPYYFQYFVHIPKVPEGKSPNFHSHYAANTILLALDSKVISPATGDQQDFIDEVLSQHTQLPWKMAFYHAGLYPANRKFDNTLSAQLRSAWGPLFDQYHLNLAFENHDHVYKRSYPIYGQKVVENGMGTVYLGDGSMGVKPRTPSSVHKNDYLVMSDSQSFFHYCVVYQKNITIYAINTQGVIFDYYVASPNLRSP